MTADKIWETILVVLGGIITGGIGLFTGWLLHNLQRAGERAAGIENRRREFLAFMAELLAEAQLHHPPNTFGTWYGNKKPNLQHAATLIRGDFAKDRRAEFDKLISIAGGFSGAEVENPQTGQKNLLKAIHDVIEFTEAS
jgi:hypothetical protein